MTSTTIPAEKLSQIEDPARAKMLKSQESALYWPLFLKKKQMNKNGKLPTKTQIIIFTLNKKAPQSNLIFFTLSKQNYSERACKRIKHVNKFRHLFNIDIGDTQFCNCFKRKFN